MLVVRGGAIGDFILTIPAIRALRDTFADTHLEVLGYPVVAELAQRAGIINAFRSIEARPLARFFARNARLDDEWSAYFESFHLIVSYLYDPDDIFKTNVGRASKAQFIQGQHRPREEEDLHATAVFLKPLEKLAIFDAEPIPRLRVQGAERLGPGSWLGVHPGSGSEKKNWPEEKWIEFLRALHERTTRRFLLVGGEAEGERLKRLESALRSARVRVAEKLPLAQLAGLLAQCEQFVGHDSGITHLAAAAGRPVLALWGPSRPEIWRPLNPAVRILEAPESDLARLEVGDVIAALEGDFQNGSSADPVS